MSGFGQFSALGMGQTGFSGNFGTLLRAERLGAGDSALGFTAGLLDVLFLAFLASFVVQACPPANWTVFGRQEKISGAFLKSRSHSKRHSLWNARKSPLP